MYAFTFFVSSGGHLQVFGTKANVLSQIYAVKGKAVEDGDHDKRQAVRTLWISFSWFKETSLCKRRLIDPLPEERGKSRGLELTSQNGEKNKMENYPKLC